MSNYIFLFFVFVLLFMCIWQVRCLEDYGEFETEDGTVVLLKKNSQVSVHKIFEIV